jgi:hypothetical protein
MPIVAVVMLFLPHFLLSGLGAFQYTYDAGSHNAIGYHSPFASSHEMGGNLKDKLVHLAGTRPHHLIGLLSLSYK